MQSQTMNLHQAQEEVEKEKREKKEAQRVMRHVARKPILAIANLLTPEKRAYMKRFGSRPAKKRRSTNHSM